MLPVKVLFWIKQNECQTASTQAGVNNMLGHFRPLEKVAERWTARHNSSSHDVSLR